MLLAVGNGIAMGNAAKDAAVRHIIDGYDKLIILCDALADAKGFCILEKRFVDTTRRYGIFPFTLERWNRTIEYKEHFESMMNRSIYSVLPEIDGYGLKNVKNIEKNIMEPLTFYMIKNIFRLI